jgi:membrane-bound lytic murein transglycosylase D
MRLISSVLAAGLILFFLPVWAYSQVNQGTRDTTSTRKQVDTKPLSSPLIGLDDIENDILRKIVTVYELHQQALVAQIDGDLVAAEEYINNAVNTTQKLMEEMPELQSNRRFVAMYRAILTEYQEFYGIMEPMGDVVGDIFDIRDELFKSDDDFFSSDYLHIPKNLNIAKTDVPLVQNATVSNYMAYYWIRRPDVMERWLERSELYFPMMERIFREEGAPTELVFLSMIESGLVPTATSRAKAVGLWQFMQATGSMYGLKVDSWVDERRDPEKATRAAARHLKDLYNVWGDWHLALAGYNVSPGRIRSSIRSAGNVKDYWAISPYLPAETRGYVPSYIAATIIAGNREQFGFKTKYRPNDGGLDWDTYPIMGSIPLKTLAAALNISADSLKVYNPELLRNATPPGKTPYALKIPKGSRALFEIAYQSIPSSARQTELTHTVKKGETLGAIARVYDTTVRELMEVNSGLTSKIQVGQKINVPSNRMETTTVVAAPTQAKVATTSSNSSGQNRKVYVVRKGDTLGKIASQNRVTVAQIQSWNKMKTSKISIGQRLIVSAPSAAVASAQTSSSSNTGIPSGNVIRYEVKKNDNLDQIAKLHNVSVDSIKKVNNLDSNLIMPGQILLIER